MTDTSPIRPDLLLAHASHLRALARRLLGDDPLVDDVVQRTYVAALENPPRSRTNLRGWLATVARNFVRQDCRSEQRREFREQRATPPSATPSPGEVASRVEQMRLVSEAVLALPEPYRTTLLLRFFEDLQPTEIATQLGIPAATVRTRLRRGLAMLRERLDDRAGGDGHTWKLALVPLAIDTRALVRAAHAAPPAERLPLTGRAALVLIGIAVVLLVPQEPESIAKRPQPTPPPRPHFPSQPGLYNFPMPAPPPERRLVEVPEELVAVAPERASTPTRESDAPPAAAEHWPPILPRDERRQVNPDPSSQAPAPPQRTGWRVTRATELPGVIALGASPAQQIGMDANDVRRFVEREIQSPLTQRSGWDALWRQNFLLMCPEHRVDVPAFVIGQYEVTNAQWAVFLAANERTWSISSSARNLDACANELFGTSPDLDARRHQHAWTYLLRANAEVLGEALGTDAPGFDAVGQQVQLDFLPVGTELRCARFLPPPYWNGSSPPEDEIDRPVRGVSWEAASAFCRWAGLHLPRETEWERAARGRKGQRFAWGDRWDPLAFVWAGYNDAAARSDAHDSIGPAGSAPDRPLAVATFGEFATPDGVHHLAGNVSEWVLERAEPYADSETTFPYAGFSQLARGGSYHDRAAVFLAADRAWDGLGGSPLHATDSLDSIGLRVAAYHEPGRDLTVPLAQIYAEPRATRGPPLWFPKPLGLTGAALLDRTKRAAFQSLAETRTAGVLERFVPRSVSGPHVHVSDAACGVAVLPIKGLSRKSVKTRNDISKLAADREQVVFLGVLTGTPTAELELLQGANADRVWTGLDAAPFQRARPDLESGREHIGAFLVLRGGQVAVYSPDPGESGSPDDVLRGEPLGYLPVGWRMDWVRAGSDETTPSGERTGNLVRLRVPLPALDNDGEVLTQGYHAVIVLELHVRGW